MHTRAVRKWLLSNMHFLRTGVRIKKWNVPIHETEDLVLFHLEENHVLTGFSKAIMMSLSSHLGHVTVYASFFSCAQVCLTKMHSQR